jgi:hypothetical protein
MSGHRSGGTPPAGPEADGWEHDPPAPPRELTSVMRLWLQVRMRRCVRDAMILGLAIPVGWTLVVAILPGVLTGYHASLRTNLLFAAALSVWMLCVGVHRLVSERRRHHRLVRVLTEGSVRTARVVSAVSRYHGPGRRVDATFVIDESVVKTRVFDGSLDTLTAGASERVFYSPALPDTIVLLASIH